MVAAPAAWKEGRGRVSAGVGKAAARLYIMEDILEKERMQLRA